MSLIEDVFNYSNEAGLGAGLPQVERLLSDLGYERDLAEQEPRTSIAPLWKKYLDLEQARTSPPDTPEKIAFVAWFESQLSAEAVDWSQAFRANGFNFVRTRLEV